LRLIFVREQLVVFLTGVVAPEFLVRPAEFKVGPRGNRTVFARRQRLENLDGPGVVAFRLEQLDGVLQTLELRSLLGRQRHGPTQQDEQHASPDGFHHARIVAHGAPSARGI
jgi:hypothetical protein